MNCDTPHRWKALASGGVWFLTNPQQDTGAYLSAGGNSWNQVSDRATKENLSPADGQAILEKLASLPVLEYNLKSQDPSIRHVGLVAQDFATFGYGESDTAINVQDADGVAMAAIQALYAQNQALQAESDAQQEQIDTLEARLAALETVSESGSSSGPVSRSSPWPAGLLPAAGLLAVGLAWFARRGGGR